MIAQEAVLPKWRDERPNEAEASPPHTRHQPSRWVRGLYRALGLVFLGLAAAGVVLPGLPATPFVLLAVWAFGRGAPEWAARMERDSRFGPILANWRERRAVPRRAKGLAVLSMLASFALLASSGAPGLVLVAVGVILVGVATYLVTRPSA